MKLQMQTRATGKKSAINATRREGNIPAVIYVQGQAGETIAVKQSEFMAALRQVQPGHLPSMVFSLTGGKGKERRVIVKDIQYHPTTYNVLHLDFEELHDDVKVNVKVPIECVGVVDCIGIKLGGVLRQVIRHLSVRCLPRDIPTMIEVDIRQMNLGDSKRLSDLDIPAKVRPLADLNEIAIIIGRR